MNCPTISFATRRCYKNFFANKNATRIIATDIEPYYVGNPQTLKDECINKIIEVGKLKNENLKGIRVVRAFNAEGYQQQKFENVNNNITKKPVINCLGFVLEK